MTKNFDDDRTYLLKEEHAEDKKREHKQASRCRKGFILACCLVMQVVSNGVGFGLGVMYVEIQRVFDVPRTQAALVQSVYMGVMTAIGIIYKPFIKRFGTGLCVSFGTVLGCLGLIASAFSTHIYMVIIFTGVVGGIGISINYLAPFITASLVFGENSGVPLIFLTTGASLGQFIFPYSYDIFITQYGWNGAFILVAAMALHCVPAGLLVYTSRDYMAKLEDEKDELGNSRRCECVCDVSILSDVVIVIILSTCLLLASTGNTEAWFLVDVMTLRGFERSTGSLFVSLIGLFNFCGRLTGVLFRFKLKVPTIYHWIYCMPIIGLGHFLVLWFSDFLPLLLACMVYGFAFGIAVAQTPAVMFEAAGLQRYPNGMGFVNICYGTGNFVGGLIGGIIKDNYGNYDPVFYLAIAASLYMGLASAIVVLIMKRRKRLEENHYCDHGSTTNNTQYNSTRYGTIKEENC